MSNVGKMVEGRCMKCKTQREMKNPKDVVMANGRHAVSGVCPVCGTKMFKIGKSTPSGKGGSSSGKRRHSGGKANRRSSGKRR